MGRRPARSTAGRQIDCAANFPRDGKLSADWRVMKSQVPQHKTQTNLRGSAPNPTGAPPWNPPLSITPVALWRPPLPRARQRVRSCGRSSLRRGAGQEHAIVSEGLMPKRHEERARSRESRYPSARRA
eukprot:1859308-Prymnesium_polylepis.1